MKTVQVAFRLPADLVARIDAYAAKLTADNPGLEVNRAVATRALIVQALDALDAKGASGQGKKGR